jgi:hypothetical protein
MHRSAMLPSAMNAEEFRSRRSRSTGEDLRRFGVEREPLADKVVLLALSLR